MPIENTKHTKWPGYTALVLEDGQKWYANIFHISGSDEIESFIKQGEGESTLNTCLQSFGAPEHLTWHSGAPGGAIGK